MVDQVHGSAVAVATGPGHLGEADAVFTTSADLPIAVFTADCVAVVMESETAVGVAHAGWRGAAAGVVRALRDEFELGGHSIDRVLIGPHIRSCCFEVGDEVSERFPGHQSTTSWGTTSVDLSSHIRSELEGLDTVDFGACTFHEPSWFSHRRNEDRKRLAAVVMRPTRG